MLLTITAYCILISYLLLDNVLDEVFCILEEQLNYFNKMLFWVIMELASVISAVYVANT